MDVDPTAPIYKPETKHALAMARSPRYGVALFACTLCIAIASLVWFQRYAQNILFFLAAAWAIGAPTWFLYEYHFIYRESPGEGSWELFKHGQQLAIPVWASVATSLYALGASDLAKTTDAEYVCHLDPIAMASAAPPIASTVILRCSARPAK